MEGTVSFPDLPSDIVNAYCFIQFPGYSVLDFNIPISPGGQNSDSRNLYLNEEVQIQPTSLNLYLSFGTSSLDGRHVNITTAVYDTADRIYGDYQRIDFSGNTYLPVYGSTTDETNLSASGLSGVNNGWLSLWFTFSLS